MGNSDNMSMDGGIDDILARIMSATGIRTQAQLAEELGVRRAAITDAKRRRAIPSEWFLKLCRRYGLNPVWLESGFGPARIAASESERASAGGGPVVRGASEEPGPCRGGEFAFVPMVRAVPRMGSEGLEVDDSVEAHYAFRRDWLRGKGRISEMRLLCVAGDSMEPTLRDGDIVLVDQSQKDVVFGKIYVVGIDDGIVVKRLDKRPGKLVLVSDNRDYQPVEINLGEGAADIRIVGRVVWMAREAI